MDVAMCVGVCTCVRECVLVMVFMLGSKGNLLKLLLSFHLVGSRNPVEAATLGVKNLLLTAISLLLFPIFSKELQMKSNTVRLYEPLLHSAL